MEIRSCLHLILFIPLPFTFQNVGRYTHTFLDVYSDVVALSFPLLFYCTRERRFVALDRKGR